MPGPPTWTMSPENASRIGRDVGEGRRIPADHERQHAVARAGGAAGQRRIEVARPGRGDPAVLAPLHLRDRWSSSPPPSGPGRGSPACASITSITSGELGTQTKITSDASATAARRAGVLRPECHGGVDRAPAARGHGHVVPGLHEVAGHRQPHGAETDESNSHGVPPGTDDRRDVTRTAGATRPYRPGARPPWRPSVPDHPVRPGDRERRPGPPGRDHRATPLRP